MSIHADIVGPCCYSDVLTIELDLAATERAERGACVGFDNVFAGVKPPQEDDLPIALRMCDRCPVRVPCTATPTLRV